MKIKGIDNSNIKSVVEIYIEAYSKYPWNETYNIQEVSNYIKRFMGLKNNYGWILSYEDIAIGMALGSIIPSIGSDYFRIEDFCILPRNQNKGHGSAFIKLLSEELIKYKVDSILLNTVEGFPSYKFYLKNNFKEVDTSRLLYLSLENK